MSIANGQPQCCQDIVFIETIECATVCERFPDRPIASFVFNNFNLIDISTFNTIGIEYVRWILTRNNQLVYDFGFQDKNDTCLELANGCVYGSLDLGLGNVDIINFIELLLNVPSLPSGQQYTLTAQVKDGVGQINNNINNVYTFTT
jgi:hypothetical protein